MEKVENKKEQVLKMVKEKASKLPLEFIVGAAIGGGLYYYASKSKVTKTTNVINNVAKLVAPYVIIAFLDKLADVYDERKERNIVDVEAEVQ